MKIDKKITIVGFVAALLVVALYLAKRKEDTRKQELTPEKDQDSKNKNNLTRGQRNNNPFNIRYNSSNSWKGQTGSDGAFCVFDTMAHGIRAGGVLLRNYLKAGKNTIRLILTRFAPSSENNTESYIAHVAKLSGIGENVKLSNGDLWKIAVPMMLIESGYTATPKDKEFFENPNL